MPSYLQRFKEQNPRVGEYYNDDEIIDFLPKYDPQEFGSLDKEQVRFKALDDRSAMRRGFSAGIDQLQAMGGGVVGIAGDLAGSDTVRDFGLDIYRRNMEEAALSAPETNFLDIDGVGDALNWAGYTLGNLVPMMATSIAGGGIGGILAKEGVKKSAAAMTARLITQGMTKQAAAKEAGAFVAKRVALGQMLGAGSASIGMSTGSIYGETEDAAVSAVHGLIAGSIDALPIMRIFDRLGASKVAKEALESSVIREIGKQGVLEASTEAVQTFIEQHAGYWVENEGRSLLGNLGDADWREIGEAAAAGALGGAVMGGGTSALKREPLITRRPAPSAPEDELDKAIAGANNAANQVRQRGGDALSAEIARATTEATTLPQAVITARETAKALFGDPVKAPLAPITIPGQMPDFPSVDRPKQPQTIPGQWSQPSAAPSQQVNRNPLVAPLISQAESLGMTNEVTRLEAANRMLATAERFRQDGRRDRANFLIEKAAAIADDVQSRLPQRSAATTAPDPTGEPVVVWTGRRQNTRDGFPSRQAAEQSLGSRQRTNPELDWRIEEMPTGKFRLAGYPEQITPTNYTPQDIVEPADFKPLRRSMNPQEAAVFDALDVERQNRMEADYEAAIAQRSDRMTSEAAAETAKQEIMSRYSSDAAPANPAMGNALLGAYVRSAPVTIGSNQDSQAGEQAGTQAVAPAIQYKSNGKPFPSEEQARNSMPFRKTPGASIVPVDGGFGIQFPQATNQAQESTVAAEPVKTEIKLRSNGQPFSTPRDARLSAAFQSNPGAEVVPNPSGGYGVSVRIPAEQAVQAQQIEAAAQEAATSPLNSLPEPTPAQIEAGNYKKGHVSILGLDVSIENPKGSTRSGTDPDGKEWSVTMNNHYGYIRKTQGADGDHVDVFVGPNPASQQVFVVDQVDKSGKFDEHKALIGFSSEQEAVEGYKANYDKNWKVGPVTAMSADQFKQWVNSGDTAKPLASNKGQLSEQDLADIRRINQQAERAKRQAKRRQINPKTDSLVQAAIKLGGLNVDEKMDITGDTKGNKNIPGIGALFSDRTGTSIDDLATKLNEYGYIPPREMENLGGVPWLHAKLKDELSGRRKTYSLESDMLMDQMLADREQEEADRAEMLESQREQEYARIADEYGQDIADLARKYDNIIENAVTDLSEEAQYYEEQIEQRLETIAAGFSEALDPAQSAARNEQLRQADDQESRESSGIGRSAQAEAGSARPEVTSQPGFNLETQTEQDFQKRDAEEKARKKAQADIYAKADADAQLSGFTLSASSRPADEIAARGTGDMLVQTRGNARNSTEATREPESKTGPDTQIKKGDIVRTADGPQNRDISRTRFEVVKTRGDAAWIKAIDPSEWAGEMPDNEIRYLAKNLITEEDAKTLRDKLAASQEAVSVSEQQKSAPVVILDDFGEKLGGARKDRDRMTAMSEEMTDEEIAGKTLSEIWPKSAVDAIEDKAAAAFAFGVRSEVPSKPRKTYALNSWVQKVKTVRELVKMYAQSPALIEKKMRESTTGLNDLITKIDLLNLIERDQWGRIGSVQLRPNAYRYVDGKQVATPLVSVVVDGRHHNFNGTSLAQALDGVNQLLSSAAEAKAKKYEIRGYKRKNEWFIVKAGDKEYRKLKTFTGETALADARKFLTENVADIDAAWEKIKERDNIKKTDVRNEENRPRTGKDYRKGRDVTPEQFTNEFGFRGVEFGNWVGQGKNAKERQGMLNQAYDALMDLAAITNIPPKAISLNGSMGLAFGSRGSGSHSAHFEPGNLVINLTKTKGAGTLAHEWFHALDNYFSRLRGGEKKTARGLNAQDAYRENNYITYKPEPMYVHRKGPVKAMTKGQLEIMRERHPTAGIFKAENWMLDPKHPEGVRPEVERAFADLVETLDRSPMKQRASSIDNAKENGYWSRIIERAARSFENYVITKMHNEGYDNDYLANVKDWEGWGDKNPEKYPYLKPEEIPPVAEAFDALFGTIEYRETDTGVALFSRQNPNAAAITLDRATALIGLINSRFQNAPDAIVVQGMQDQRVPEAVRQEDIRQRSQGASGDPEGFYYQGKAYIVLDGLSLKQGETDAQALFRVFAHEVLGHAGLRGLFRQDLDSVLLEVMSKRRDDISRKAKQYGLKLSSVNDRLIAAEEVLAEMAQTNPENSLVTKAIELIRQSLRRILMSLPPEARKMIGGSKFIEWVNSMTDAEIIDRFIVPAREFIRGGNDAAANAIPVFMRSGGNWYKSDLQQNIGKIRQMANKQGMIGKDQAKQWIDAATKKGMFKADEVEWTGLKDWLDTATDKVSVDDIQAFVDANGVQVQDVTLGDESFDALSEIFEEQGYSLTTDEGGMNYWDTDDALVDFKDLPEELKRAAEQQGGPDQHRDYQLSGGENYREILLTLPPVMTKKPYEQWLTENFTGRDTEQARELYSIQQDPEKTYKSSHWDQPNVLAHIRMNDRTDTDGNKVLFIEEIQSDWAQDGRKKGFIDEKTETLNAAKEEYQQLVRRLINNPRTLTAEEKARIEELKPIVSGQGSVSPGVPSAPFVTNTKAWTSLALKRIIAIAAEGGYDKVAFINGDQSHARFPTKNNGESSLPGLKSFYNEIIPATLKDLAKKFGGGQIENVSIDVQGRPERNEGLDTVYEYTGPEPTSEEIFEASGSHRSASLARQLRDIAKAVESGVPVNVAVLEYGSIAAAEAIGGTLAPKKEVRSTQPGITITDAMREKVDQGLPLFSRSKSQANAHDKIQAEFASAMYSESDTVIDDNGELTLDPDDIGNSLDDDAYDRKYNGDWMTSVQIPLSKPDIRKVLSAVSKKDWYHGSPDAEIDQLERRSNGALFLASEPDSAQTYAGQDGRVYKAKVQPKNPLIVASSDLTADMENTPQLRQVIDAGYDSIIPLDYGDMVILSDDAMVAGNPDIRFSRNDSTGFAIPDETLTAVAIRKIQDKFKFLKDLQASITKSGGTITEENNAYLAEELFHGKAENDIREMQEQYIEPLADKMAKFDINRDKLDQYLYARHAAERNARIAEINPEMPDGGSGMTNAEAAAILSDVRASGKQDQYDQLAGIVYDMLSLQRDMVRSGGLESDATIDAWEDGYQYYVPLKGWAEDTKQEGMPRTGKGFAISGRESKRAMGRGSQAASPTSFAIIDLTEKLIRRRKNEVGNAFLKLVRDNPNPEFWQVFTDERPETQRTIKKVKDPATGEMVEQVTETAIPMAMLTDRYFTTKKGGKTFYIKLEDPRLMKAMKNIGPESNNALIRTMAGVTRVMSALNTSYSPEFMISNFARDVQTAILNLQAEQSLPQGVGKAAGTKIAAKTAKDVPSAMRAIYASLRNKEPGTAEGRRWQALFEQFRQDGAKTGWFDMKDLDGQSKSLDNLVAMAQGGFKGRAMKFAQESARFVENINQAVENAVRLSAYANAIEAGISRKQASSLAKNMTVNFNRRGEVGTTMNALYMFANASVQGTANLVRTMATFKGDGSPSWKNMNNAQKIASGIVAGAYFIGMANRMAAGEDEDEENWYDKVPDYVKQRNIVLMKSLFGGPQDGSYWKIPLPYGYNVFSVLGTSMESVLGGGNPVSGAAADVALATMGSFSPIGFQDSDSLSNMFLKNAAPTIIKPIVEVSLNENFMGSSIYTENMPFGTPKPDSSLGRQSTPEAYRALSMWMNKITGGTEYQPGAVDVNPDVMQHFLDYFGGSAYAFFGSKVPDYFHRAASGVVPEENRIPFISRVSGTVLPYADTEKFYRRRDQINQVYDEFRALPASERDNFEDRAMIRLRPLLRGTERQLSALRKQRDAIYSADMSLRERDPKLKEIEQKMKTVVARFNKAFSEVDQ